MWQRAGAMAAQGATARNKVELVLRCTALAARARTVDIDDPHDDFLVVELQLCCAVAPCVELSLLEHELAVVQAARRHHQGTATIANASHTMHRDLPTTAARCD